MNHQFEKHCKEQMEKIVWEKGGKSTAILSDNEYVINFT